MKARVVAVGEAPLAIGFALAGVSSIEAESREDALNKLAETLDDPTVGIVLVDHALVDALPEPVRMRAARRSTPILLSLPSPDWSETPDHGASAILDLLQRAIGYRVRLQ
ncbi:MAG TPA: V-type ATP synthase subunit F [Gemmatimonadaceae bacterium]|nr:V-type ATP synthase subunit F [Gemmatimonadaceae bacterium]